uniref:DnaJ homolog subfamily C member 10 n=1 Tax=Syphacia muris TaxID=451379 RepID=A0A158R4Y1_9BILA
MAAPRTVFIFLTVLLSAIIWPTLTDDDDFYKLLGVSKDADNRSIRRAFKKLALQKHPDKNPNDKNAHAEFVRLNRAYEVLMDEELRKKYDQFGEEGLKDDFQGGNQYQSWTFYRDNFGIYDDDPEIITLSRADFQQTVINSGETWFVNFYSTFCSHCHQLAPTWRKFAREMDGVLRIGAVNCAEDPMLCQSQNVMAYPSLVLYPEGIFFNGPREMETLVEFAMSRVSAEVHYIKNSNYKALTEEWDQYAFRPWVVDFCDEHDNCLSVTNRRKLSIMLEGVANVGTVNCIDGVSEDNLCDKLKRTSGIVYYPARKMDVKSGKEILSLDPKEIVTTVLNYLPGLNKLEDAEVERIISATMGGVSGGSLNSGILVYFVPNESIASINPEFKKLPSKIGDSVKIRIGVCTELDGLCEGLFLAELPKWVMFKPAGGYEINYERKTGVHEVISFSRESVLSPMITLSPGAYKKVLESGEEWLIDYFAPWCPPCQRLLHELRKLHNSINEIKIGTVDCVAHAEICQQAAIGSYPATKYYKDGKVYSSVGFHDVNFLADFIEDAKNPRVKELTPQDFEEKINSRAEGVTWLVDYFAPWCGPCQQLAPEFRKLAREVTKVSKNVFFGTVDCDAHRNFCSSSGVHAYPTLRLFSSNSRQQPFDYPNHWWRDYGSINRWLSEYLPSKVKKVGNDFYTVVLSDRQPWLVDFYAPWCGHCIQFAPVLEIVAEMLEGRAMVAKVNCDQWPGVCQSAGIRSYPTVRLYLGSKDGSPQPVQGYSVQSQHAETIVQIVDNAIGTKRKRVQDEL